MSDRISKLLIIVACLAALLIGGAVLGQCGECSLPDLDSLRGWSDRLRPEPRAMSAGDVFWLERGSSGPWNLRTLARVSCDVSADDCAGFAIAESRQSRRVLRLGAAQTLRVRAAPAAAASMPVTFDLDDPDKVFELEFDKRGGTVRIQCRAAFGQCVVRIR